MDGLKVAADSSPKKVAGALMGVLEEAEYTEIQAVGAAAVNQGVKAIAIAKEKLENKGTDLICIPAFMDLEISGKERTAIKLIVEIDEENNIF